ncbi:hypothetical protein HK096_004908 [Nowakowskiella sp. JEL0078]|nr:hypothetical protein HK096_004908 [Nowakowskiella sp. JEL0078]
MTSSELLKNNLPWGAIDIVNTRSLLRRNEDVGHWSDEESVIVDSDDALSAENFETSFVNTQNALEKSRKRVRSEDESPPWTIVNFSSEIDQLAKKRKTATANVYHKTQESENINSLACIASTASVEPKSCWNGEVVLVENSQSRESSPIDSQVIVLETPGTRISKFSNLNKLTEDNNEVIEVPVENIPNKNNVEKKTIDKINIENLIQEYEVISDDEESPEDIEFLSSATKALTDTNSNKTIYDGLTLSEIFISILDDILPHFSPEHFDKNPNLKQNMRAFSISRVFLHRTYIGNPLTDYISAINLFSDFTQHEMSSSQTPSKLWLTLFANLHFLAICEIVEETQANIKSIIEQIFSKCDVETEYNKESFYDSLDKFKNRAFSGINSSELFPQDDRCQVLTTLRTFLNKILKKKNEKDDEIANIKNGQKIGSALNPHLHKPAFNPVGALVKPKQIVKFELPQSPFSFPGIEFSEHRRNFCDQLAKRIFPDPSSPLHSLVKQQSYGAISEVRDDSNLLSVAENSPQLSFQTSKSNSSLVTLEGTEEVGGFQHHISGLENLDSSGERLSLSEETPLLRPTMPDVLITETSSQSSNSKKIPTGVILVLIALFVAESSRGIVIPTMTPYILHLGGTVADVGISVSLYSIGKLISAAPLGYFTEYTGSTRLTLMYAALFSSLANVLYACAYLTNSVWVIFASRFLLGLSTSVMGIGRAYMAAAANAETKKGVLQSKSPLAKYIAWSGVVQYIGFSLTPIFSAIFRSPNGKKFMVKSSVSQITSVATGKLVDLSNIELESSVSIMDCILPAYFLAILNILLIFSLWIFMKYSDFDLDDSFEAITDGVYPDSLTVGGESSTTLIPQVVQNINKVEVIESNKAPQIDPFSLQIAFFVFFYMNFAIRGIIGVVEALAPSQYQDLLGPDHPNLAGQSAIFFTVLGLFGLITFLVLDPILKITKIHANHMLTIGIAFIALGSAFMIPFVNMGNIELFTFGIFAIWAIGSPICQTLTILSLSELLGSKPQAVIMSYLTNAGSLGRIVFPSLAAVLPTPGIEICNIALCLFSLIFALCYHWWLDSRIRRTLSLVSFL